MIPYFIILNSTNQDRISHVNTMVEANPDKNFSIIPIVNPSPVTIKKFIDEHGITIAKGKYQINKLSCHFSHYLAYSIIINKGIERAIILEDDFTFCQNYDDELNNVMSELPADFDLIRLFHPFYHIVEPINGKKYIGLQSALCGDVGNLVSLKGARILKEKLGEILAVPVKENSNPGSFTDVGFVPNDIVIHMNDGGMKSFNSVQILVDTVGDVDVNNKRKLASTIHFKNEYYEQENDN